jgi:ribonuclease T1
VKALLAVALLLLLAVEAAAFTRLGEVRLVDLPKEARTTLNLIRAGGPFPYSKDGSTFGNREGQLPQRRRGYYQEYTVQTRASRDRGAKRIVAGSEGEYYYTEDHYRTFRRITE